MDAPEGHQQVLRNLSALSERTVRRFTASTQWALLALLKRHMLWQQFLNEASPEDVAFSSPE
jgi:hypothetical protein